MSEPKLVKKLQHMDGTDCPGIYECERCMVEWFLNPEGLFYIVVRDDG